MQMFTNDSSRHNSQGQCVQAVGEVNDNASEELGFTITKKKDKKGRDCISVSSDSWIPWPPSHR